MSGNIEGGPETEAHLTLPPSAAERLATLEAEREIERAAIRELEGKLREAAAGRMLMNERGRFRGMIPLGFFLGIMTLIGLFAFCSGGAGR